MRKEAAGASAGAGAGTGASAGAGTAEGGAFDAKLLFTAAAEVQENCNMVKQVTEQNSPEQEAAMHAALCHRSVHQKKAKK